VQQKVVISAHFLQNEVSNMPSALDIDLRSLSLTALPAVILFPLFNFLQNEVNEMNVVILIRSEARPAFVVSHYGFRRATLPSDGAPSAP